ncbi:MAG: hypothetical protein HYY16_06720 [Planctomycetes bacterium]|nr:hypothetical protein [Planctomycetota bacterium]
MRIAIWVSLFAAFPACAAVAQEEPEHRMRELKKWFDDSRREAEQEFRQRMEKLERVFREKSEGLRREFEPREEAPPRERIAEELLQAVRRLEKQLGEVRRELGELRRQMSKVRPVPGDLRDQVERELRGFGREFHKMFEEGGFDWERFGERLPGELHRLNPERFMEFFRHHQEWFPEDFEVEEWLKELRHWLDKRPGHEERKRPDRDHF